MDDATRLPELFALNLAGLSAVLLGALGASCRSRPPAPELPAYPALLNTALGEMQNVAYCGHVWLGSTPLAGDLDLAARRGVRKVIDASAPYEWTGYDLSGTCAALGMDYIDLGIDSDAVKDDDVEQCLAEIESSKGEPVLLFCGTGSRSAMLLAIHRTLYDGVPLEQSLADARRAGVKPGGEEALVAEQVEKRRQG